jgi:spermidine synthase
MTNPKTYSHLILDLCGCPEEQLLSAEFGIGALRRASARGGLTVVGEFSNRFSTGGYSCGLLLSESHISLHTWPEQSFCALDVFLCRGDVQLMAECLLDEMKPVSYEKKLIIRGGEIPHPEGREIVSTILPLTLDGWVVSSHNTDYFEAYRASGPIRRRQSPYQLIEVFNNPSFGKILMLNGDIQLSTRDEAVYHEFLVHPAMLSHPEPKEVLIVGGGDGGALRQTLKYKGVKRIVVVDVDKDVIEESSRSLAEVSKHSFEDPRVEVVIKDAGLYLRENREQNFDVVIIDLTAPDESSQSAYGEMSNLVCSRIAENGFVAMHSGWWASMEVADYPSVILRDFSHILLQNRWVDSFACFWSFLVAWNHNESEEVVLKRITAGSHIENEHFIATEYGRMAFSKAGKQH